MTAPRRVGCITVSGLVLTLQYRYTHTNRRNQHVYIAYHALLRKHTYRPHIVYSVCTLHAYTFHIFCFMSSNPAAHIKSYQGKVYSVYLMAHYTQWHRITEGIYVVKRLRTLERCTPCISKHLWGFISLYSFPQHMFPRRSSLSM
jgi:hypothetical protein